MDSSTPGTRSPWMDAALNLTRAPVRQDTRADACVIGAGMAGIACAYTLARRGLRVAVLDAGTIGGGETGRTTAHLANAVDDRYSRMHGDDSARIAAESHTAAISFFERSAADEGIACDFSRVDGYLFLPPGESLDLLEREHQGALRAGLAGVERLATAPSFLSGPCLRFPHQGQFHPLKFLDGLAAAIERLGGLIFTGSRVARIENGPPLRVVTAAGPVVSAEHVIVATNSPINDLFAMHTKQAAYRTYALSMRAPGDAAARALFWDTSESAGDEGGSYHYVRSAPHEGGELLIVGGGDHPTGDRTDADGAWLALEGWARTRWPCCGEVVHRWSGQVMEPLDGIAFIGRNPTGPDGVYIVTGDSGMGMTHGAIAALMMPDLVLGVEHPWARLYDPGRKPWTALGKFVGHAGRMAGRYGDWLTPGAGVEEIARGEGRVVRRGLHLLAVYRDCGGALHARSAVCTHLGCIVQWNAAERSWDCPCHGSRYSARGDVLNGPALKPLAEAEW